MTPKTRVDSRHPVQRCTKHNGRLVVDLCVGVHEASGSEARHDTNRQHISQCVLMHMW